ncbi:MAG: hypothetical protein Sapg2KO_49360 [Saprospiraceae bacterium]
MQFNAQIEDDYTIYHKQVIQAETLIAEAQYQEAYAIYEDLFQEYDFIFLREYQVASQLALQLNEKEKAKELVKRGVLGGWKLKSIKKNTHLAPLWTKPEWKDFKKTYTILYAQYEDQLNSELKGQVKKMFAKDQRKALLVLFRISSKAQDRYAEKKFAQHSIQQMQQLNTILDKYGYPGERLIGPNYWTSTILSHHNSISQTFNQLDPYYPAMKSQLQQALFTGYVAPAELALIDEWHRIVKQQDNQAQYGLIKEAQAKDLEHINQLRAAIYLRSTELRNQLLDVEQKTGMNFYLPKGWIDGKIAENN